ncbi:hypothetical protein F5Y00DRAFT_265938 [Daldinia vernicosa]|uniref:uncharacterized protein n=1 Tax=Daldinia vernicosa TaxID=114800 RepID=UPI002007E3EF|nr:uncharacterized protein F5Y00DRAFT_265938 [Daldinia vernicosa]KAI0845085.1 hypothetical protein F5Y00DRAFT_265938 [Daldinia vernicosa]
MASKFTSPSGLTTILRELRGLIYDNLEDEDIAPLAQTCQQIRSEVLSRMPGGRFIDFGRAHDHSELRRQVEKSIEVKKLDLIAEPWYSSGSALKVGVTWKPKNEDSIRWRTSYWTIRDGSNLAVPYSGTKTARQTVRDLLLSNFQDQMANIIKYYPAAFLKFDLFGQLCAMVWELEDLSSPMARYIYLYHPKAISVTFQAAYKGYFLLALIILRTKMFDICRILKTMGRDLPFTIPTLTTIQFCGGRDPVRPKLVRRAFWEMRPQINLPNWMMRQDRRKRGVIQKSSQAMRALSFLL